MNDNAIERFECTSWASDVKSGVEMEPDAAGDWVRYSDHKAAVVSAANAAVDAERIACEKGCFKLYSGDIAYDHGLTHCISAIRARTDPDAQAALEAVKREARNEALREAFNTLRTYAPHQVDGPEHDVGYASGYATAQNRILALMEDQSDG